MAHSYSLSVYDTKLAASPVNSPALHFARCVATGVIYTPRLLFYSTPYSTSPLPLRQPALTR